MFIELPSSVLHLYRPSGVIHTRSHTAIEDSYGLTVTVDTISIGVGIPATNWKFVPS